MTGSPTEARSLEKQLTFALCAAVDNLRVKGWLANRSSLACHASEGWCGSGDSAAVMMTSDCEY
jgi:hypothetical protein